MLKQKIAILPTDPQLLTRAQALAAKLDLPLIDTIDTTYDFLLILSAEHLALQNNKDQLAKPFYIDFLSGKNAYRRSHTFIKNELLAKAIGVKGNQTLKVIDATAGLGRDSFVLAHLGCDVVMLERSPIIAALLADGLSRLMATEKNNKNLKLQLINTDAFHYLTELKTKDYPDVIYLDPMYPHRTKTALVKKEMRLLRELVGEDEDAEQILPLAINKAKKCIVVKRPRLADFLNNQKPDFTFEGKQHRFDIYLTKI